MITYKYIYYTCKKCIILHLFVDINVVLPHLYLDKNVTPPYSLNSASRQSEILGDAFRFKVNPRLEEEGEVNVPSLR
jgi:hypothetical protein